MTHDFRWNKSVVLVEGALSANAGIKPWWGLSPCRQRDVD